MKTRILSTLFMGAFLAVSMHAEGRIVKREEHQQDRIAQGVKSGELTPRETARIERKEAKLRREVRHDRKDGGGMTAAERAKLERQQDRLSKSIRNQKHDGQEIR